MVSNPCAISSSGASPWPSIARGSGSSRSAQSPAPCRETAPRLVLAAEAKNVPIVAAELGHLAAARGAAALARDLGAGG